MLFDFFDFQPLNAHGNDILMRKILVANACAATVNKAMEVVGGRSFFRKRDLERLFRAAPAGPHYPLPEKTPHYFTGHFTRHGSFPLDDEPNEPAG